MNSDDKTLLAIVDEFKRGGWVMGVLGALGMLARLILTNEKFILFIWIRKGIAGGIVGVLMYLSLYGLDMSPMYKSVLCSMSGSFAPEIFESIRLQIIKKLKL